MKKSLLLFVFLLLGIFYVQGQSYNDTFEADMQDGSNYEMNEDDIRFRFMNLTSCITPQWTEEIKVFIKGKLKHRESTERLLGKAAMYAPFVEKCIAENELPMDLQALYVIESGLNPRAISRAGAGGLWQLMPETAKTYGVNISTYVDERFDPYKSTQAAMKLLKELHNKYNDWALALAAYNAGPARVDWAIKHGKSTDYWKIRRFLMKETQNYVPAFLAASYVLQSYSWHNIRPRLPELDLQVTSVMKMKEFMSFTTISQVTDIPISIIQQLNPSYINDFIPATTDGNFVILPSRVRNVFENYLNTPTAERQDISSKPIIFNTSANSNDLYVKTQVTVSPGDNLDQIAEAFNCHAQNIKSWNYMASSYISRGQDLNIYIPKVSDSYVPQATNIDAIAAAAAVKPIEQTVVVEKSLVASVGNMPTSEPMGMVVKSVVMPIMDVMPAPPVVIAVAQTQVIQTPTPVQSTPTIQLAISAVMVEVNTEVKEQVFTNPLLQKLHFHKKAKEESNFMYHFIGRNESLNDIAERYGNTTVSDILALNGFNENTMPSVGMKIKVKVL